MFPELPSTIRICEAEAATEGGLAGTQVPFLPGPREVEAAAPKPLEFGHGQQAERSTQTPPTTQGTLCAHLDPSPAASSQTFFRLGATLLSTTISTASGVKDPSTGSLQEGHTG